MPRGQFLPVTKLSAKGRRLCAITVWSRYRDYLDWRRHNAGRYDTVHSVAHKTYPFLLVRRGKLASAAPAAELLHTFCLDTPFSLLCPPASRVIRSRCLSRGVIPVIPLMSAAATPALGLPICPLPPLHNISCLSTVCLITLGISPFCDTISLPTASWHPPSPHTHHQQKHKAS